MDIWESIEQLTDKINDIIILENKKKGKIKMSEGYKIIIILVCLCFLLGWDLGLLISNKYYKEENQKQTEYIEQLEMQVDRNDLVKIKRKVK